MHTLFKLLLCGIALIAGNNALARQPEKLLLAGSGWNKIVIIDAETQEVEWEHPLEPGWECNSADCNDEGQILFSYRRGARLIDRDHRTVWNIEAPEGCEMQTARTLPDGNSLIAWAGQPAVIMEVSPKGEIVKRTEYAINIRNPHGQFRQINRMPSGNYLIPIMDKGEVHEITPEGKCVKTLKVEGNPFSTLRAGRNVYWVACGDGHSLMKVNWKTGKTLQRIGQDDIEGARLFFVAELLHDGKGGLFICNWQGHDPNAAAAKSPLLLRIDKKGHVVWKLRSDKGFGRISTVTVVP